MVPASDLATWLRVLPSGTEPCHTIQILPRGSGSCHKEQDLQWGLPKSYLRCFQVLPRGSEPGSLQRGQDAATWSRDNHFTDTYSGFYHLFQVLPLGLSSAILSRFQFRHPDPASFMQALQDGSASGTWINFCQKVHILPHGLGVTGSTYYLPYHGSCHVRGIVL